MSRIIANEEVWIGFATTVANISAPTTAEIDGATDLTGFLVTLDASTTGNQVPTPAFDSLFETSISGTVTSTFTAEFYRDDASDTAWTTLPRATAGYFIIGRFGLTGTTAGGNPEPASGDVVEVWPVKVTSRSAIALANNDVQRMNIECAVTETPDEDATVA